MSTLVGHFVSSPREREKRDRREDDREGQGRKCKMNLQSALDILCLSTHITVHI